jgi:glycosyltransferase involved in cell wall biosynthesis
MHSMRLLFIADGRSPIASNWIRYFIERGDQVHLISTFSCDPYPGLAGFEILPVAFSSAKKAAGSPGKPLHFLGSAQLLALRTTVRQWLGPLTIRGAASSLRRRIRQIQPDLVHALRIPFEGMLAAEAHTGENPLVVSVWGNDFTLHGGSTPLMQHYTEWALKAADALHADCHRDIRLAKQWGFGPDKPTLVIPTNGGLLLDLFHPPSTPVDRPVVVNPRGFRAYVRNDAFFKAIPLILQERPDARFRCSAMAAEPQAIQWIRELHIEHAVELLPAVSHPSMADVFRSAQVVVSPTLHDGTPNSLLEGMACGCFPVAGDLESIREWITPGQNGLLIDATDPKSIAQGVLAGLQNENLRRSAAGYNLKILASRAEYGACMRQAGIFYERIA